MNQKNKVDGNKNGMFKCGIPLIDTNKGQRLVVKPKPLINISAFLLYILCHKNQVNQECWNKCALDTFYYIAIFPSDNLKW